MVPGRSTVHGGPVQDRRQVGMGGGGLNSTTHDSQTGRPTLLDKLTSKFSTKQRYALLYFARYVSWYAPILGLTSCKQPSGDVMAEITAIIKLPHCTFLKFHFLTKLLCFSKIKSSSLVPALFVLRLMHCNSSCSSVAIFDDCALC